MLVILLLSSAILVITFMGSKATIKMLSRSLIHQTTEQIQVQLGRFFDPITNGLNIAYMWGQAGLLDIDEPDYLDSLLTPLMENNPQISSLLVADERGRENMILRTADKWVNRQTKRDLWGDITLWVEWTDRKTSPIISWRSLDYDPRARPWYQGAVDKRLLVYTSMEQGDNKKLVHWTKPYTFYTTKEPGITASTTYELDDGLVRVVGFDVLLNDISNFVTELDVSEHGFVFILTDERQIIGLPKYKRYANPEFHKAALLKTPKELGVQLITNAASIYDSLPDGNKDTFQFESGGKTWWGGVSPFKLTNDQTLWIATLVPESDLLMGLTKVRQWIIAITLIVIAIAVVQAVILARRYSQPIVALARDSNRISRLNLNPSEPIISSVTEIKELAQAHDRMRIGLQSMLKMERDIQLAKQIQQSTFPNRLPVLSGFDIDVWNKPAEETGGDTYDVIGYTKSSPDNLVVISTEKADRAVLLVADATGHGIGPALSATQARSMLRMAVRMGETIPMIATHMNEQFCKDFHAGRFITVWLGELNTTNYTLTSFSAGQAPLFYFDVTTGHVDVIEANTPPMGVVEQLKITANDPFSMNPGDIFVVLSDGIFDASDASGNKYGKKMAIKTILKYREYSSKRMLEELRQSLKEFMQGAQAKDDCTAMIIKRTHV